MSTTHFIIALLEFSILCNHNDRLSATTFTFEDIFAKHKSLALTEEGLQLLITIIGL